MNVLYPMSEVTPSYGGIGAYTYKIINGLLHYYKNYNALIITCNQQQEDTFSQYFSGIDRVEVISLFELKYRYLFVRDLNFQIKIAKKIWKLIKQKDIDIIHHQTGHCDLFFTINFLNGIPKIITSHGDTYTLLKEWKKAPLKNIDEKFSYFTGKILYHEEKLLYKKSNKIISVANHVNSKIIDNYKINPDKITTIYNYVDPEKFYFHPGNFTKPYKIGFIGRPYFIKGFYDLIKILNNNPNKDIFEWHLVTDVNLVKKFVKNDTNIHYYNSVPQSKLSELYDKMDLMFIPSYSEACPTVVIESILKGKLCIVRNIIGIIEIINDCMSHLFKNIEELNFHDIIDNYTKNKEYLLNNLKTNREKIKNRYGTSKIIKDIYNIYKNYT